MLLDDVRQGHDLAQLALRQYRRGQQHLLGILRRGVEHAAFQADLRGQRHDQAFAQRVDWRIRDLGERLAEILVQRPRLQRQHRDRRVVAHGAGRFGFVERERLEDHVALLARQRKLLLEACQHLRSERLGGEPRIDQVRLQVRDALAQPALERRAGAIDVVDRGVVEHAVLDEVDRDHLAGAEPALGDDALGRQVPQSGFGGYDQVLRLTAPACGAQAVAVERAGGVPRVAQHDSRGPSGSNAARSIVERFEVFVDVLARGPRRRNQDAHRRQHVEAAGNEHLEHVVETLRVGAIEADQRLQAGKIHEWRFILR